jgi:hypothetical protein
MPGKANSTTVFDLSPALPPQRVNLEVDQARQREYGHWLFVGLILVAALLFNGWQRNEAFDHGRRLVNLDKDRAREDLAGRLLSLEVESLRSPARIEGLARGFGLVPPGREDTVVLPRILPPPQPPSSVVASR